MNKAKADFFDEHAEESWAADEYTAEEMSKVKRLLQEARVEKGLKILEPGCGTGRLTEILAQETGPEGLVVALDISPKMIEFCLPRLARLKNCRLFCASMEDFPYEPNGFDVVICHQVFPHFDDKAGAVANMARMLKPGGRLVVFHFKGSEHINDVHRKAGTIVEKDLLPPEKEMKRIFQGAGFTVRNFEDDRHGYLFSAELI